MGKLIATDLDGTLFYPKARINMISKKSLKFLRKHADNGGKIVLVSGRNSEYLKRVAQKINRPVDMIGCNSAFIMANNEFIKQDFFDTKKLKVALNEIEKIYKPKGFFLMSEDNRFVVRERFKSLLYRFCYRIWNFSQGVYREPFIVDKKQYNEILNSGRVAKVMILFGIGKKNRANSKEANKSIRELFSEDVEASWSGEFIELSPVGCSKSEGLKYYLNYFNINHSDVYVVGDSGNDISMFNEFPEHSFCMKHASLSVSKYAKYVIRHFSDLEKFID